MELVPVAVPVCMQSKGGRWSQLVGDHGEQLEEVCVCRGPEGGGRPACEVEEQTSAWVAQW